MITDLLQAACLVVGWQTENDSWRAANMSNPQYIPLNRPAKAECEGCGAPMSRYACACEYCRRPASREIGPAILPTHHYLTGLPTGD